ncbi:MAG: hypothetical protein LBI28_00445 [Treponema sp.]|nr:hypothetical protein [Treponema sp.]
MPRAQTFNQRTRRKRKKIISNEIISKNNPANKNTIPNIIFLEIKKITDLLISNITVIMYQIVNKKRIKSGKILKGLSKPNGKYGMQKNKIMVITVNAK